MAGVLEEQVIYPSVLDKNELFLLKNLDFLKDFGFYLAGGTGLALQFGHRTSIDLDFYTPKSFEIEDVAHLFNKKTLQTKITGTAKGTIFGKFKRTEFSLFHYPYKLLEPFVSFKQVFLASIPDIAAMKASAIIQRGTKRDFIDIYYLLKKYSLKRIIAFTLKKYPSYQEMLLLKALIYFKDAEEEELTRAIQIFDKSFSWKKAKEEILKEVRRCQLEMLKRR